MWTFTLLSHSHQHHSWARCQCGFAGHCAAWCRFQCGDPGAGDGAAGARQRTPLAQLKNLRLGGPQPGGAGAQPAAAKAGGGDASGRTRAMELGAKTFQDFKERRQRNRRATRGCFITGTLGLRCGMRAQAPSANRKAAAGAAGAPLTCQIRAASRSL